MNKVFLCVLYLLCFIGCAAHKPIVFPPSSGGSVIDSQQLNQSTSIALHTLKPGPGAAADDKTDRVSALILQGISNALSSSGLTVVSDDAKADLFCDGFVEEMSKDRLYIDVDLWLPAGGKKMATFWAEQKLKKKDSVYDAAEQLGKILGSAIASSKRSNQ